MAATRRIVAISDTHCHHERIELPEGDILVHGGDFCSNGRLAQARAFARWFQSRPHPHKVVIAGNHDLCLEDDPELAPRLFTKATYLFDREATVADLRFYGSPWQPWFLDWAFNLQRGAPLRAKWKLIPTGIDVLVTHGPPKGILDKTIGDDHVGCEELRAALDRVRPRVHVFGHIHEGYGTETRGGTLFANACTCTVDYVPTQPPIVIDVVVGRAEPARRLPRLAHSVTPGAPDLGAHLDVVEERVVDAEVVDKDPASSV